MTAVNPYLLKVTMPDGKFTEVTWNGVNGPDAARQFYYAHPGATVWAWKVPQSPVHVLGRSNIID